MSALATAEFTRLQRKGKFGFEHLFLLVSVLVYFPRELGLNITFFLIVVGVLYLVMVTRWVRERGGDKNE
jgi:hypothetical protein